MSNKKAKAAVLAGLVASATGNVHQTNTGAKAGIFTSPSENFDRLGQSFQAHNPTYLTTGTNPGTFSEKPDIDHPRYREPYYPVHQTGMDNKSGVFVTDDNYKGFTADGYGGYEYRDLDNTYDAKTVASDFKNFKPETEEIPGTFKTTGENPGIFKTNDWDKAHYSDGGKKRTKRYRRRLTHRKKKTMKRRKTRRTKNRR